MKNALHRGGFTLVELLVVMAIIAILMGLILGVGGTVQRNALRSRASAEIAAIELALERYKIDNGDYPSAPDIGTSGGTYNGDPNEAQYLIAGRVLFEALMGRTDHADTTTTGVRQYMELSPGQVRQDVSGDYIIDPFGNAYGYYYKFDGDVPGASSTSSRSLFNEVVPDIWSTSNNTLDTSTEASGTNHHIYLQWVTNWPNN